MPAIASASRSRRAVFTEISSSSASSRGGDPAACLEHEQRGDEAIGAHGCECGTRTGHLMAIFASAAHARDFAAHGSGSPGQDVDRDDR